MRGQALITLGHAQQVTMGPGTAGESLAEAQSFWSWHLTITCISTEARIHAQRWPCINQPVAQRLPVEPR